MKCLRLIVVDVYVDGGAAFACLLREMGHHATFCMSARQPLEQLDSVYPDALFVDLDLAGMTGMELALSVKKMSPEIALVAIMGHASPSDCAEAKLAGFDHFLDKPVDFDELCRVLDRLPELIP